METLQETFRKIVPEEKLLAESIQKRFDEVEGVDLTEEETNIALLIAKEQKLRTQINQEYAERIRNGVSWEIPTAREMFENLRRTKSRTGKWYKLTPENKLVIRALCLYFANDEEKLKAYNPEISLGKGICITGMQGVGKTHLMNFFSRNPKQSYLLTTCRDVAEKYRTDWEYEGVKTIDYYASQPNATHPQPYNQERLGICFGDLGTEDDKNNYGNKMNVIDEIFFKRYETGIPLHMTHFTTNLNGEEIKQRYGVRFYDRLKESCNWIVLEGESFRD